MTDSSVERMLNNYRELIRQFTSGQMSADSFAALYTTRFKSDPDQVVGDEFDVLDRLFADVDDYVGDPALRKETRGIDGEELRARTCGRWSSLRSTLSVGTERRTGVAMMKLGLENKQLQSVLIDHTVTMRLSGTHFIVIESPFVLEIQGRAVSLSPNDDPDEAFEPVRALLGQIVSEALADENGSLSVTFDSGAHLHVEPDPAYEAWNVSGPEGALVVCTPGGTLAVWSAHDGRARPLGVDLPPERPPRG